MTKEDQYNLCPECKKFDEAMNGGPASLDVLVICHCDYKEKSLAENEGKGRSLMGMHCACGVKKRDAWKCECDWNGWYMCWESGNEDTHRVPVNVPIKEIPDEDGVYLVRVFEDGDDHETESEFSLIKKDWGEFTNEVISHWKIEYDDNWMGYRGVYAWKKKTLAENKSDHDQKKS